MTLERTVEGLEARLWPRGFGRVVNAGFLGVWLCGWLAGECLALWFLVRGALSLLTGEPPQPDAPPLPLAPAVLAGLFLLVWLAFWTLGGYLAARELLRVISSSDHIVARPDSLVVHRRLGPFLSTKTLPRPDVLRVYAIARKGRVLAETPEGPVELTLLARGAECESLARALGEALGMSEAGTNAASLPEGWREVHDAEEGAALLRDPDLRRARGRAGWCITALLALFVVALATRFIDHPHALPLAAGLSALTAVLAWGSFRLSHTRLEWRLDSGLIRYRRRSADGVQELFEGRSLELVESSDSDGDPWFTLNAVAAGAPPPPSVPTWSDRKQRRQIAREMDDPTVPRRLGAWLARRTGLPLADRTTAEHKKKELQALIARLEAGSRFSRFLARHARRD